ncbi:MAG: helix-turn-helix transcriptional regulator [Bacilli bacterium]|nr:helix-turn-helix transcriptional regulator [Bacilli bacterium]
MESVGKRISELRSKHNMSQEALAEKLLVSTRTIIKWESGNTDPSISNLSAVADIFNVTTDYLLGRDEIKKNNNNKQQKYFIARTIAIAVFIFLLTLLFVISTYEILINVSSVIKFTKNPIVGMRFPATDIADMTVKYAATQGVTITPDSDTFVQWQTQLKSLYTLHGTYWWHKHCSYQTIANLICFSLAVLFIIYALPINIVLFFRNWKHKLKESNRDAVLSFISLNIPLSIIMLCQKHNN